MTAFQKKINISNSNSSSKPPIIKHERWQWQVARLADRVILMLIGCAYKLICPPAKQQVVLGQICALIMPLFKKYNATLRARLCISRLAV